MKYMVVNIFAQSITVGSVKSNPTFATPKSVFILQKKPWALIYLLIPFRTARAKLCLLSEQSSDHSMCTLEAILSTVRTLGLANCLRRATAAAMCRGLPLLATSHGVMAYYLAARITKKCLA